MLGTAFQLLACAVCGSTEPSRVAWVLPVMFIAPYLVSGFVIRAVRRLE